MAIDNQPPVVSNVTAAPNPTPPNAPVTLTATLDDRTTDNSNIASAEYAEYKVGDVAWMPMIAADGAFDSPLESVTATLTTLAQPGTHTLCVRGTDAFANTSNGAACTTVTVMAQNTLHVGAINGAVTSSKKGYTLNATVLVLNENNAPIPGVTVYTKVTPLPISDMVYGIRTRTNKSGVAKVTVTSKTTTAWEVCVTNLTKSGYAYDQVETCKTF